MKQKRDMMVVALFAVVLLSNASGQLIPDETVILYVDATAVESGTGLSWDQAFSDLQVALSRAAQNPGPVEIRVAQGTYRPGGPSGDRQATFQLINNVTLKGAYAGLAGPDPNRRAVDEYETFLSGDLNGDDSGNWFDTSRDENSYHVVTGSGTDPSAILDGFTITGGSAKRVAGETSGVFLGAGMYNEAGHPSLNQCTFYNNYCLNDGAGMCNINSNPTLTQCTFRENFAMTGGGMYNSDSSPTLTQCSFVGNVAGSGGAGLYNQRSNSVLDHCIFDKNSTGDGRTEGGGMCNEDSAPTLTNCGFTGNLSSFGGAIANRTDSHPTLANCFLIGNSARNAGGGICNSSTHLTVTHCTFSGNSAKDGSGLACGPYGRGNLKASTLQIANCILWDAEDEIRNEDGSSIEITYSNVRGHWPGDGNIYADPAFFFDNGYYLSADSPCIEAGTNTPPAGLPITDLDGNPRPNEGSRIARADMGAVEYNPVAGTIALSTLDVTFSTFTGVPGSNTHTVLLGNGGGASLQWEALAQGPWLSVSPATGQLGAGETRALTLTVDASLLAHGIHTCLLSISDPRATNTPLTMVVTLKHAAVLSVPTEYTTLQEAIDAALHGDLVLVGDGVYTGQGNKNLSCTKPISFRSENGPENCIIDCENEGRAFRFAEGTRGEYGLDGFTICHGSADQGAGIYYYFSPSDSPTRGRTEILDSSASDASSTGRTEIASTMNAANSLTIQNCIFRDNTAEQTGGAVYSRDNHLRLTNCSFTRNAAGSGGGICSFDGSSTLINCTFVENSAEEDGGGMHNSGSGFSGGGSSGYSYSSGQASLTHCSFIGNSTRGNSGSGGGLYNRYARPILSNCIFSGNSSRYNGGGINDSYGFPVLRNCAFSGNSSARYGGGIYNTAMLSLTSCTFSQNLAVRGNALVCYSYSQPDTIELDNCILWDNGEEIFNESVSTRASITIRYSNVQGGRDAVASPFAVLDWRAGNIDSDPLFVDPEGPDNISGTEDDNLQLAPLSPCVDTGDPNYLPQPGETDLAGHARVLYGDVDMGAYEFQGLIFVDDDAVDDPGPGDPQVSDPLENGAETHPMDSISEAIDWAKHGYRVLVREGVYGESIDFRGKAITVAGFNDAPMIEVPLGDAVTFHTGEGSDSVLRNFILTKSGMGISLNYGSRPTIRNITLVDNDFGIAAYENSNPDISNCILWSNRDGDLFQCQVRYSCIETGAPGIGNLSLDPLFVDASTEDYHLKSAGWFWNTITQSWAYYEDLTSPCIDAGDPDSGLGNELLSIPRDPDNEYGLNTCINMGAYGGTPQASLPPLRWRTRR